MFRLTSQVCDIFLFLFDLTGFRVRGTTSVLLTMPRVWGADTKLSNDTLNVNRKLKLRKRHGKTWGVAHIAFEREIHIKWAPCSKWRLPLVSLTFPYVSSLIPRFRHGNFKHKFLED